VTREPVLHVNPIACDGRGLCAEIAPELITLDDWGFPIIEPGPIAPGLMPEAEAAVRICPLLALRLAGRAHLA
jgi:ferredoxin